MENKRYFFHPTGKMNQDYSMDDENKTPVYEAKVLKKGIRIDSGLAHGKIGMSYHVTLKGQELATMTMSTANGGKSIFGARFWYDIDMAGENVALAFLTAFALAKTEQTFYD